MPRNGTGVYSLPVTAFVSASVIISGDVNSDFSDIATALTQSLATTGVTTMTGPVRLSNGAVTAPSMAFNSFLGTGFYRAAANVLGVAVSSVDVAQINVSATVSWGFSHIFNSLATFASVVSSAGQITSTATITGALDVTGGMIVGFSGAPVVDTLALGDTNLLFDFNSGTAPRLQFDANDRIAFTRASNVFSLVVNNVTVQAVQSDKVYYNGHIDLPEVAAPASAATGTITMYAKDSSGVSRMFYKDVQGNEVPMGGIGYWEVIGTFDVTTSVSAVTFSFTKTYSRLVMVATSVAPATSFGPQLAIVQISDDNFATQPLFTGSTLGLENGTNSDSGNNSGYVIATNVTWTAANEGTFTVEAFNCDKTGIKTAMSYGYSATQTIIQGSVGSYADNAEDAINAMRLGMFGGNIRSGSFTLYGQAAN